MSKKTSYIFNNNNLVKLFNGEITKSLVFTTKGIDYFIDFDNHNIDEILGDHYEIYTHVETKLSIISVYENVNAVKENLDENSLYYENFGCKLFGNVVFIVEKY